MLTKLTDVLSISVRYEKMFEQELYVRTALTNLYLEILLFLQRIRATISTGCKSLRSCQRKTHPALTSLSAFTILAKSIFRSVDVEFQDNVQRLSRACIVLNEEMTLAHRQRVEDLLHQQRFVASTNDQRAAQSEQKLIPYSEGGVQEGPCLHLAFTACPKLTFSQCSHRDTKVTYDLAWSD